MSETLIRRADVVVTMDSARRELAGADVLVRDGRIAAVGTGLSTRLSPGGTVIEAAGCIVTPGLVNTHHHLYQTLTRARAQQADLFTWLRDILPSGQRFDVVVLDPAKQTRDREAVDYALKRYFDMNRLALQAVAPGGIFLTCSCTGLVSEDMFVESLRRAAWQAGRTLQVLRISGAGADHPFLVHVPEGRYLKAVFCRVL